MRMSQAFRLHRCRVAFWVLMACTSLLVVLIGTASSLERTHSLKIVDSFYISVGRGKVWIHSSSKLYFGGTLRVYTSDNPPTGDNLPYYTTALDRVGVYYRYIQVSPDPPCRILAFAPRFMIPLAIFLVLLAWTIGILCLRRSRDSGAPPTDIKGANHA